MKNLEILKEIKDGKKFTYPAYHTKNKSFVISCNDVSQLELVPEGANYAALVISENKVLEIIGNVLDNAKYSLS